MSNRLAIGSDGNHAYIVPYTVGSSVRLSSAALASGAGHGSTRQRCLLYTTRIASAYSLLSNSPLLSQSLMVSATSGGSFSSSCLIPFTQSCMLAGLLAITSFFNPLGLVAAKLDPSMPPHDWPRIWKPGPSRRLK